MWNELGDEHSELLSLWSGRATQLCKWKAPVYCVESLVVQRVYAFFVFTQEMALH